MLWPQPWYCFIVGGSLEPSSRAMARDICLALLKAGAKFDGEDIWRGCLLNWPDVVATMLDKLAGQPPLEYADFTYSRVDVSGILGGSSLNVALDNRMQEELCIKLVEAGCPVITKLTKVNFDGCAIPTSDLARSCELSYDRLVRLLIEKGAKFSKVEMQDRNCLRCMARLWAAANPSSVEQ